MYTNLLLALAIGCGPGPQDGTLEITLEVLADGQPAAGLEVDVAGQSAETDEWGLVDVRVGAGPARVLVRQGDATLFDGLVRFDTDGLAPGSTHRIVLPHDRLDVLEPFLAGPPPVVVNPPLPYTGRTFTLTAWVPGADALRLEATGDGCGALGDLAVKGDRVTFTGNAGRDGHCSIHVGGQFGHQVVEVGSTFRVSSHLGTAEPAAEPLGQGLHRAAGVVAYEDRAVLVDGLAAESVALPVRGARVEVRRASDDALLGVGGTDTFGVFDIPFRNDGPAGYTVDVLAERQDAKLAQRVENEDGLVYKLAGATVFDEVRVPDRHDIHIQARDELAAAFNVYDAGVTGALALRATLDLGIEQPLRWRYVPDEPSACGRTCFVEGAAFIDVDDGAANPDAWDDAVLLHHYGHFVLAQLSRSDAHGGAHNPGERLDPLEAWTEGAATFISALSRGTPLVLDADGDGLNLHYDIETLAPGVARGTDPPNNPAGQLSEGAVAAVLWDMADLTEDAGDSLADPEGLMAAVVALGGPECIDVGRDGADLQDVLAEYRCAGGDAAAVDGILRQALLVPAVGGCGAIASAR